MSGDRILLVAMLLLSTALRSGAENLPSAGSADARVRTALYSVDEVYRLYGVVGFEIDLEFEAGETYAGLAGGDLEALTVGAYENHLVLKPKAVQVATNLTVFTSRRHYQFLYSAGSSPARNSGARETDDPVIYAVRFTYPALPAQAAKEVDLELARAQGMRPRNYDYWFCGHPSLRPVGASDDGVHTRITFAPTAELPAVFVRNDDDTESLLNFSIDAGDVVIHRVASRFVVRRGRLTGCIVNKGFVGGGQRLKSGTVAPNVERERKGVEP